MSFIVESKFNLNDLVYLVTDPDQKERIVTGILLVHNSMKFWISCGDTETCHYEPELSAEKDVLKSMGIKKKKRN